VSRNNFYYCLFFSLPIIYYLSLPIATGDLAVWVAHGKYFLSHGEILRTDIFSVLATRDLVYPFGTCLLYGVTYGVGGLVAVSLLHKLVLFLVLVIWHRYSLAKLKEPFSYFSLLVIFLACFGISVFLVDRPALLGILPFLVTYLILQKDADLSGKDVLCLNLINIAWVNIHGSWLMLIFLYVFREFSRGAIYQKRINLKQVFTFFTLLVSSLVNPFGYKVFTYFFETISISKTRKITEWEGPSFSGQNSIHYILYTCLLLLVISYCIFIFNRSREKFNKIITSPFIPILLMGIHSVRNTIFPYFVLIPFVSKFFLDKGVRCSDKDEKKYLNVVIVFLVFVFGAVFLPNVKPFFKDLLPENKREVYDKNNPFEVLPFLNTTKENHAIFNDWEYGSFLILFQKHPVFLDTRNIIYSDEQFEEYKMVMNALDGWESILDNHKIKYILLKRNSAVPLLLTLNSSLKWKTIIVTKHVILYQKIQG
jgi:hypothetical protein